MKMIRLCIACILGICMSNPVFTQELQVGQQMPEHSIKNVINNTSKRINLKDYKGKLVIIEFWGLYCTSCLKRLPEIDSIQREFGDKVQILLVNTDSRQKTMTFFRERENLKMPENVPFITSDVFFQKSFPYDGVPSYVWVDTTGKIIFKTDVPISKSLISSYFSGQQLFLPKSSEMVYLSSLFDKAYENSIPYATYFSKSIDSIYIHINYKNQNVPYSCRSIEDLYQFAYNESDNEGYYKFREPGRTILDVKDTIKYRYPSNMSFDQWRVLYGYYYHAILPDRLSKDKYKIMQEDLKRYFDMDASIEKRAVKCLLLIRTSDKNKLTTTGGEPGESAFAISLSAKDNDSGHSSIRVLRNKPFQELYGIIRGYGNSVFGIKVIDSTGFNGNIDFEMPAEILYNLTVEKLRKVLNRYDLDLVESDVPMDVLVLREKG